jgi:hypothetical protein
MKGRVGLDIFQNLVEDFESRMYKLAKILYIGTLVLALLLRNMYIWSIISGIIFISLNCNLVIGKSALEVNQRQNIVI